MAERYAAAHDLRIIKEYSEPALSGKTADRPQLKLMLSGVGKLRPAALIVWKTDRLAREHVDSALMKRTIRNAGCSIHYIAEPMPNESKIASLMEMQLEAMAEFYSAQLNENIIRGMTYNAERCYYNGHPTLGYMPEPGKKASKRILVDSDTAPIVQRIRKPRKSCEYLHYHLIIVRNIALVIPRFPLML